MDTFTQKKKIIILISGALIIAFLVFLLALNQSYTRMDISVLGTGPESPTTTIQEINPFDTVAIQAKSAFVYDVANKKVLYEKNSSLQLPLASLTKVMTALVASEIASTTATIQIKPTDLAADGDNGLMAQEKWTLKNLSDFSLVVSSNDGADAMASAIGSTIDSSNGNNAFIQRMNVETKRLGLEQMYFLNGSGLDINESISGGYGSAKDVAKLFEIVLKRDPHLFEATTYSEINVKSEDLTHKATNTNKIVDLVPSVLASKTGFTDLAGGNLAMAFSVGPMHPIIAVVMNSTTDGRFEDMHTLIEATIAGTLSEK